MIDDGNNRLLVRKHYNGIDLTRLNRNYIEAYI